MAEIDHVASDSLILSPVETGFDKYCHRLTQQRTAGLFSDVRFADFIDHRFVNDAF